MDVSITDLVFVNEKNIIDEASDNNKVIGANIKV